MKISLSNFSGAVRKMSFQNFRRSHTSLFVGTATAGPPKRSSRSRRESHDWTGFERSKSGSTI